VSPSFFKEMVLLSETNLVAVPSPYGYLRNYLGEALEMPTVSASVILWMT